MVFILLLLLRASMSFRADKSVVTVTSVSFSFEHTPSLLLHRSEYLQHLYDGPLVHNDKRRGLTEKIS